MERSIRKLSIPHVVAAVTVVLLAFPAVAGVAPAAPGAGLEPLFIKAQFQFASERLAAADALMLVGMEGEAAGPALIALEWRKESSPFGFISWRPYLAAAKGILPDQLAPGVPVQRGANQDAARLPIVNPQPGVVYEASLTYDPGTGELGVALVDVNAGSLLYGLQAKVTALPVEVRPAAGEDALSAETHRAFLPVGVRWQVGERAPHGGVVPLLRLSKQQAAFLEVELPESPLSGSYRLIGAKDGVEAAWVDTLTGAGKVQVPLLLDGIGAGTWQVRLEYVDGEKAWTLGSIRTIGVAGGVVSLAVSGVERRGGKILGRLVAQGDGPVQGVPLTLYADVERLVSGAWVLVEQGTNVLEIRTDVPEGVIEIPFSLDVSAEEGRALRVTFYAADGFRDGVQILAVREQHVVPQWDTGTMGGIPQIDIAHETWRQVVVDHVPGQYLGHPDTVLLGDDRTILVVYPLGHGGPTVLKRSEDGGKTWSERLPVDESWGRTANVPTIFRMVDPEGVERLFVYQNMARPNEELLEGRGGNDIHHSISLDNGRTWTPFEKTGLVGPVVPNTIVPISGRRYLTVFQLNGTIQMSTTSDGGLTWDRQRTIARYPGAQLTEPAVVKGPDGKQLAVLIRENTRQYNSMLIVSPDEGQTWSQPVELPPTLTGDRHMPRYAPDGRLVITFRDMANGSPTKGDFVAWVGTWDDLVNLRPGQYRVRLLDNTRNDADTGYAGLELLPDGTFVSTTYVPLTFGARPSVVSLRFKIEELDARVEQFLREQAGE